MSTGEKWGADEWIEPAAPVDRLTQMPALAAQAHELGQTRNPDGDHRALRSHTAGSRPAARLDLIDVADDTTEARGELRALILWCSRPIWEGVDHDTRQAHPQPLGTPTWETECAWLAGIWAESRAQLDEVGLQMTAMTLDDCYRALCRVVGLRPPRPARCLECGAPCEVVGSGDQDMLVCTATRWAPHPHEFPGPRRLAHRWRVHRPMATSWFETGHDGLPPLPAQWFKDHRRRNGLAPAGRAGREFTWSPWAVIVTLWPTIIDASRDAA